MKLFSIARIFSLVAICTLISCTNNCGTSTKSPPQGLAGTNNLENAEKAKIPRHVFQGTITEVINKEGFSYIHVKTENDQMEWVAVLDSKVKVGDLVSIEEQAILTDFHSKSLNRTFAKITFGTVTKAAANIKRPS
ncbi:MAG: hypothetical protein O2897_02425 [bacterium]|nr:hypothetical protein [bacterium]